MSLYTYINLQMGRVPGCLRTLQVRRKGVGSKFAQGLYTERVVTMWELYFEE